MILLSLLSISMTLLCSRVYRLFLFSFVPNLFGYRGNSRVLAEPEVRWVKFRVLSYQSCRAVSVSVPVTLNWYRNLVMWWFCVAFICPSFVWADRICAHTPPELSQMRKDGVEVDYYYLTSSTSAGLIEELRANGPRNEAGRRFDAFFSWHIAWKWPVRKQSGRTFADYSKLSFQRTLRLQFPCWEPGKIPEREDAPKQWQLFVHKLAKHEMEHYQIFRQGEKRLIRALTTLTSRKVSIAPDTVNAEGHKILEEIRTADAEYDATTQHGRTEGITYEVFTF